MSESAAPPSSSPAPQPGSIVIPSVREFTLRAVLTGIVLGIVFGAANAYIGLRVGMTISSSIPAAVLTVALFKALGQRVGVLEANISQTVASESTALATGTIFTIPALYMWGVPPSYMQMVALCFLGAVLGIAGMIPLRRALIVDAHKELPYPEGTACAEVLRTLATDDVAKKESSARGGRWIFIGIGVGIAVKVAVALLFLAPKDLSYPVMQSLLPNAVLALEVSPALIAVGFILGYRQSAIVVSGAILASFVLTPLITIFGGASKVSLFPEKVKLVSQMNDYEIWKSYVRYIGAGAVAFAGLLTVGRNLPTMWDSFTAVARGVGGRRDTAGTAEQPRTDRDLPGWFVALAVGLVVLLPIVVPNIFAGHLNAMQRAVCACGVGFFGLLFVAVAARIVGLVGVTSQPTSGIILLTLLGIATAFAYFGWTGPGMQAAVLTVGTIVGIAASKSGDASQDMKTGYLVGASPYLQQAGQLIGAATACWAIAATMHLLANSGIKFGDKELAAPQATLMKTIIEGVLSGQLPWNLVGSGAGITLMAALCGVSGLAFAIGIYLSLGSMLPVFVGGCVRGFSDWTARRRDGTKATGDTGHDAHAIAETETNPGILAASGLVAGEGLAGVLVAGMTAFSKTKHPLAERLNDFMSGDHPFAPEKGLHATLGTDKGSAAAIGASIGLLMVGLACILLATAARKPAPRPAQ